MCVVGNHTTSTSTVCSARIGRPPNNCVQATRGRAFLFILAQLPRAPDADRSAAGKNARGQDLQ